MNRRKWNSWFLFHVSLQEFCEKKYNLYSFLHQKLLLFLIFLFLLLSNYTLKRFKNGIKIAILVKTIK